MECKQDDSELHRYECAAMKAQLFDLIDGAGGGRLLLRLVFRGLVELKTLRDVKYVLRTISLLFILCLQCIIKSLLCANKCAIEYMVRTHCLII